MSDAYTAKDSMGNVITTSGGTTTDGSHIIQVPYTTGASRGPWGTTGWNPPNTVMPDPEPAKLGLAYITELVSMQIGETREINGRDYLRLPHGWLLCEHDVVIPPFTKGESDESEG